MTLAQQRKDHYTYDDYASWDDDTRYELIDGVPYMMAGPNRWHQSTLGAVYRKFADYLDGKTCQVFFAPFDVRLNADDADDTVVQPDLLVVCDPKKLADDKYCVGAPDLVLEVISPSNARYDRVVKFNRYRKAGVREYWIIDPETRSLMACVLKEGQYVVSMYDDTQTADVHVLEGCQIPLGDVFPPEETTGGTDV